MSKLTTRWNVDSVKTSGSSLIRIIRLTDLRDIMKEAKAAGIITAEKKKEVLILDAQLAAPHFDIKNMETITIEKVDI